MLVKENEMNRNEAIERSAQLFLQVLEHNDNRLTDAVFDSINILRFALAMPEDAEIGDAR